MFNLYILTLKTEVEYFSFVLSSDFKQERNTVKVIIFSYCIHVIDFMMIDNFAKWLMENLRSCAWTIIIQNHRGKI